MGQRNPEVEAWLERYDNPLKPLVIRVRDILLDADPRLGETIKWSTPTFVYKGNLVSFQPRAKQFVSLLFHQGASIPGDARSPRGRRRHGALRAPGRCRGPRGCSRRPGGGGASVVRRAGRGELNEDAPPTTRESRPADAAAVATIWLASFTATYRFPPAHSADEVRDWVADVLLPGTETWIAEGGDEPVGFISIDDRSIDQLYVLPEWTGRGIGSKLVRIAQQRRPTGLEVWTFQVNAGARRFYERHGFRAVEHSDGSGNEERQPDVRYVWP